MEVQRFTKYPLLLENMAKYTGNSCSAEDLDGRGLLEASHVFVLNSCKKVCCLLLFFTQKMKRKKIRWKELKNVARKSWTTSTRQWKKLKTNKLSSQQRWTFFTFHGTTSQHVACFLPQRDCKSTRDGWTSHRWSRATTPWSWSWRQEAAAASHPGRTRSSSQSSCSYVALSAPT